MPSVPTKRVKDATAKPSRRRSKATELALKREHPECGVKEGNFAAGAFRRAKAHTNRTLGVGTPSSANKRPSEDVRTLLAKRHALERDADRRLFVVSRTRLKRRKSDTGSF